MNIEKKNNRNTRASQTTNIKYLWIIRDDGYTEYTDCYKSVYSLYYLCTFYELYMAAERLLQFTKQALAFVYLHDLICVYAWGKMHTFKTKTTTYIGNFQLFYTKQWEERARYPRNMATHSLF